MMRSYDVVEFYAPGEHVYGFAMYRNDKVKGVRFTPRAFKEGD